MRRLHLSVGIAGVIAFLVTGQLMRHHTPPLTALSDSVRLMYRSRHIYILGSALVNLVLSLYLELESRGWQRNLQIWVVADPAIARSADVGARRRTRSGHRRPFSAVCTRLVHLAGRCARAFSRQGRNDPELTVQQAASKLN